LGINAGSGNLLNVNVYPNPTADVTNVSFEVEKATAVSYVLYNTLGQAVKQGESIADGITPLSLNMSSLPQGTYTLKVSADNQVITRRIVLAGK
jgi:hypothetical protein